MLTQLRVEHSEQNFRKLNDTLNPLCPINDGVEDTKHFFLLYHTYDEDRRDVLKSVDAILRPNGLTNLSNENLLQVLLHDHESYPLI